ncbi:MAG: 1-acyl-sn-glycerol-3-phosphate acyltransferase [Saprospiraceae bacterium]|nr:1-acyl-sn-glycerol-3-phosphate acyltransferase [Saprospiraceae bacterium]
MIFNGLRFILASIRALILMISLVIFIAPYALLSGIFFQNTPERAYGLRRFYVNIAIFILGIRIEKDGKLYNESCLYVCNHRSFSDPLILLKYLDAYVIAKAEVADMPLIHTGAKLTGIIYVKRDSKDSRTAVRRTLIKTIKEDNFNVLVYPEGTTNPFKSVMEYRPGTFLEAAKHGIAVVPVVLEYKHEKDVWFNRGLFAQFFRQFGHPFTHTKLSVGPMFKNEDGIALRDEVWQWSENKNQEMHDGWGSYFSEHEKI